MKRQRGRSRNSGGSSGGGKPQHNTNRAFDSNGPEGVKVRGAAQHVYEKYQQLARDAHTAGDRVLAENHLQHAEHYFRLMRAMQPQRPLAEIVGRDQFVSGYDIDFEDEGAASDGEADAAGGSEAAGERQDRVEARRDERPRDDYRQGDQRPREDRAQNDRAQGDRSSNDRSSRDFRDERSRPNRDERPRFDASERSDPLGVIEPRATPLTVPAQAGAAGPVLRADDGEVNHAPAFLQVRPAEPRADASGESRPPRRRRPPRSFEAAETGPAPAASEEN